MRLTLRTLLAYLDDILDLNSDRMSSRAGEPIGRGCQTRKFLSAVATEIC